MAKREDESFLAQKEKVLRIARCPNCFSQKVAYNKHYKNWRCNRCEKSFLVPNWDW